jgi:molybdopterin converting factor small subunit
VPVIRYWAAARAVAGVDEEQCDADTVADLLNAARASKDAAFAAILERSSVLVDGLTLGTRDPATVRLAADSVVEVLPPFAGG